MKIAIVKLSALGDIIHTMAVLQFIKKSYPNIIIDWVVESAFKGILEHNRDINQIHTVNIKQAKQQKSIKLFWAELKKIKQFGQYDLVIDAQGLLKSAIVAKLLTAQRIIGFDKNSIREPIASWFYDEKINIAYDENTIDRNITVVCQALKIKPTSKDIINKQAFLFSQKQISTPKPPYVIFVVHSTWESRNYPKEKFVEIAQALKIKCFITWHNQDEKNKAQWLAKQSDYIDVLPKLDLDQLKYFISQASLLIGNDTGPTHIAWGLNIPSITIFGPTPVNRVYQTPINKIINSNSVVNHYKLNKNDYSIRDIKAINIIKIGMELLKMPLEND